MEAPYTSLSVAIPDSSLIDSKSLLEKSLRVAQFARALSIFRVEKVYVYHDVSSTVRPDDIRLITLLLEYLDTPQYLRKLLYPKMKLLQFAGMLPPIQSPHHKKFRRSSEIQGEEARAGVLLRNRGTWVVDVGLDRTVPFVGHTKISRKANFKLSFKKGQLVAEEINRKVGKNEYWGYNVINIHALSDIAKSPSDVKFLITSRRGKPISHILPSLATNFKHIPELVLIFGSPRNDVCEIVTRRDENLVNSSLAINMFPMQGTNTVRLEEALLGSLAIINSIRV
jgi:predicted SPOUT superfamily RNA methylase MTH1